MNGTVKITLDVDVEADAAYIELSDRPVVETRQVNSEVLVDLDEQAVVVGIETLRMNAPIPFDELQTRFHVHSDVIAALRLVRPSPSAFIDFVFRSDAGSNARLTQTNMVSA